MECPECNAVVNGTDFCLNCGHLVNKKIEVIKNESSVMVAQNNKVSTVIEMSQSKPLITPTYTIIGDTENINPEKAAKKARLLERKAKKLSRKKRAGALMFNFWLLLMVIAIWTVYYYRKNIESHAIEFPLTGGEVAGANTKDNTFSISLTKESILAPVDRKLNTQVIYGSEIFNLIPLNADVVLIGSDLNLMIDNYTNTYIKDTVNKYKNLMSKYKGEFVLYFINSLDDWALILKVDDEIDQNQYGDIVADLQKNKTEGFETLHIKEINDNNINYLVISMSEIYLDQVKELSEEKALPLSKQELFKVDYKRFQSLNGQLFVYIKNENVLKILIDDLVKKYTDLNELNKFLNSEKPTMLLLNSLVDKLELYYLN